MAAVSGTVGTLESAARARRAGRLRRLGRLALEQPLGVFGLAVLLGFALLGLFGGRLAPYDPRALRVGKALSGMSSQHLFGVNSLGQDVFSRVLAGARVSFIVAGAAVFIGSPLGALMGTLSGFKGGWFDFSSQRVSEAAIAFPPLILYLLLITAFGRGPQTIVVAILIGTLLGGHRVIRAATLVESRTAYVQAARAVGCSERRIFFRHVIPNMLPLTVILASGALGAAILAESALAFLGLGVAPGTPSWGIDMSGQALSYARLGHWYLVVFPGLAISLVVLGANVLGDALRDVWDPRLRGRRAARG
jgi:ABC-type dipeptide/oligopeptide/nickel transport system permease subunit